MGAFGCFGDQKETLPVTPDQIIHARRAHVLDQAALTDVSTACRAAGVSRTSYYGGVAKAEKYGLSALMPKDRRAPVMPNAMTAEEVSTILATAVAKATLGARQLVDHVGRGRGAPVGLRYPEGAAPAPPGQPPAADRGAGVADRHRPPVT